MQAQSASGSREDVSSVKNDGHGNAAECPFARHVADNAAQSLSTLSTESRCERRGILMHFLVHDRTGGGCRGRRSLVYGGRRHALDGLGRTVEVVGGHCRIGDHLSSESRVATAVDSGGSGGVVEGHDGAYLSEHARSRQEQVFEGRGIACNVQVLRSPVGEVGPRPGTGIVESSRRWHTGDWQRHAAVLAEQRSGV